MKRKFRVFLGVALAFSLIANYDFGYAKTKNVGNAKKVKKKTEVVITPPKQSIVMDFDTGEMISGVNVNEVCTPSSMTKMMTLYLVFEALTEGSLHLDDELPVSENAGSQEGSRSFFEAGSLVKVEDLIRSMIVHSGNDACVVVAERIAGDEAAFAELMNEKAKQFGLKNTHFVNSSGLPHADHYSTVEDLAVISRHLIADFPQYYHYFSEKTFTANGITQHNRNTLLGNALNVDGVKTGHTNAGGYGIVISGHKNGKRLIAVVNGCTSEKVRSTEVNKILAMGFNEYVPVKIATQNVPIATAAVEFGKKEKMNLYTNEDIAVSIPKKYRQSLVIGINVKEPVLAPVLAGAKVGTLTYKYGGFTSKEYDLFAHEPIAKLNFAEIIIQRIKSWFNKKPGAETPIGIGSTVNK